MLPQYPNFEQHDPNSLPAHAVPEVLPQLPSVLTADEEGVVEAVVLADAEVFVPDAGAWGVETACAGAVVVARVLPAIAIACGFQNRFFGSTCALIVWS